METAAIHIRRATRVDPDRAFEALADHIGALYRNGHVLGTTPIARVPGGFSVFANLPAADSLAARHANRQVRRASRALTVLGFKTPIVKLLGPDPDDVAVGARIATRVRSK